MKIHIVVVLFFCCQTFSDKIQPGYYTLTAKVSGYALTVFANNKLDNGPICQDKNSNQSSQLWLIQPVKGEPGYYTLAVKSTHYRLQVFQNNRIDGGPLCQAKTNESASQKWRIQSTEIPGYYTITSKFSGNCLDVFYANKKKNGALCHAQPRDNDAQKWQLQLKTPLQVKVNEEEKMPIESNLIWHDEFDGKQLDLGKWSYRQLGKRKGAINTTDAVQLDGKGHLVITTSQHGKNYHSGMISTQKKFEHKFGYYETRVKFQTQQGHWPTFWLMSPKIARHIDDPQKSGTEIDIFEYLAINGGELHQGLHWNGYKEHHKSTGRPTFEIPQRKEWNVIALEWNEREYIFYINGQETWRTTKAISHIPQFIIISLEVAKWSGDIRQAQLPDSVYFDYVRVYKKRPW